MAEIDHAVDVDLARTVEDVLMRRVPLGLPGRDQGLDVAERVAQRMARRLGWSAGGVARQVTAYGHTMEARGASAAAAPTARLAGG